MGAIHKDVVMLLLRQRFTNTEHQAVSLPCSPQWTPGCCIPDSPGSEESHWEDRYPLCPWSLMILFRNIWQLKTNKPLAQRIGSPAADDAGLNSQHQGEENRNQGCHHSQDLGLRLNLETGAGVNCDSTCRLQLFGLRWKSMWFMIVSIKLYSNHHLYCDSNDIWPTTLVS